MGNTHGYKDGPLWNNIKEHNLFECRTSMAIIKVFSLLRCWVLKIVCITQMLHFGICTGTLRPHGIFFINHQCEFLEWECPSICPQVYASNTWYQVITQMSSPIYEQVYSILFLKPYSLTCAYSMLFSQPNTLPLPHMQQRLVSNSDILTKKWL